MSDKLRVTRKQLYDMLGGDPHAVRVFERLLVGNNTVEPRLLDKIDDGYDNTEGSAENPGTTTPEPPLITASGELGYVTVSIPSQYTLTNWDTNELQVSLDDIDWYDPVQDGSITGTINNVREVGGAFVHVRIPPDGTSESPTERELFYRARRVTRAGDRSTWSASVRVTTRPINVGDIAPNAVTATKVVDEAIDAAKLASNSVEAGKIVDGAVYLEKLGVLARNNVTNPTLSESINGWGGIDEGGDGSSTYASYDATEKALVLSSSGNASVRSDAFPVDPNKIYRLQFRLKKSLDAGRYYVGLSAFPSRVSGISDTSDAQGTSLLTPVNEDRTLDADDVDAYFYYEDPADTDYRDFEVFIVGANRSVDDFPNPTLPSGGNLRHPAIKITNSDTPWAAVRFLNWDNPAATDLYVKDISVSEVGSGTIVAENILAGTITTKEIAAGTIEATNIKSGEITTELLDAEAVTTEKIASDAITANKIFAGSVNSAALSPDAISFPSDDLVAYYSFDDGSAIDTSGNGNHGTMHGFKVAKRYAFDGDLTDENGGADATVVSGTASYVTGKAGQAVGGARLGYSPNVSSEGTVALWIKIDSDPSPSADILNYAEASKDNIFIRTDNSSGTPTQYDFYIRDTADASYKFASTGDGSLVQGVWQHLAASWKNGVVECYLDGEIVGTIVADTSGWAPTDNQGSLLRSYNEPIVIDEFRESIRSLSAHEIKALYSKPTGPIYSVKEGKSRKALLFNGVDDYVGIPRGAVKGVSDTRAWSVACWFKLDDPYSGDPVGMLFRTLGSGYVNFYYDSLNERLLARINDGTATYSSQTDDGSVLEGVWHHTVMAFDPTVPSPIILFFDGVQVDSDAYPGSGMIATGGSIGGVDTSNSFGGLIDELRIYDRALSASEVANLYRFPGGVEPGVLDGSWMQDASIVADKIAAEVINALVANINDNLTISDTLGYLASEGEAEGNERTYLDPNEIVLQKYTDGTWTDQIRLGSLLEQGDARSRFNDIVQVKDIEVERLEAEDWTALISNPFTNPIRGFGYGNSVFIAVGYTGDISRSTDHGSTWSSPISNSFGSSTVQHVAFGNEVFVAVGSDGKIARSTDYGVTWSDLISNPFGGTTIERVAYGNGVFVAIGHSGKIARSTDYGATWSNLISNPFSTGSTDYLYGIAYGDGVFVVGGRGGEIARSTDYGATWSNLISNPLGTSVSSRLAYGNGTFIAATNGGTITRSMDAGATWSNLILNPFDGTPIYGIAFGHDLFVIGGSGGKIAQSSDNGKSWGSLINNPFPSNTPILDVAFGGTVFVAGSHSSDISRSSVLRNFEAFATQGNDSNGPYLQFASGARLGYDGSGVLQLTLFR